MWEIVQDLCRTGSSESEALIVDARKIQSFYFSSSISLAASKSRPGHDSVQSWISCGFRLDFVWIPSGLEQI